MTFVARINTENGVALSMKISQQSIMLQVAQRWLFGFEIIR